MFSGKANTHSYAMITLFLFQHPWMLCVCVCVFSIAYQFLRGLTITHLSGVISYARWLICHLWSAVPCRHDLFIWHGVLGSCKYQEITHVNSHFQLLLKSQKSCQQWAGIPTPSPLAGTGCQLWPSALRVPEPIRLPFQLCPHLFTSAFTAPALPQTQLLFRHYEDSWFCLRTLLNPET